jgi:hypothetical protein
VERAVVLIALALALAAPAYASSDAVHAGVGVTYASPDEARVEGRVSFGLTDFLSFRFNAGMAFGDVTRALVSGGVVYAYDVVTWVPELGVYGGGSLGDNIHHGRVLALAGVRRYFTRTFNVGLSAGAEYDWAFEKTRALVDVALWF